MMATDTRTVFGGVSFQGTAAVEDGDPERLEAIFSCE
jgi:hypothetical protein